MTKFPAKSYNPQNIVRITGDCPLIDPEIVDLVITHFEKTQADYTSNCRPPTFPDGFDVEVFKFYCLKEAHKMATLPSQLEHVTPYILKYPE